MFCQNIWHRFELVHLDGKIERLKSPFKAIVAIAKAPSGEREGSRCTTSREWIFFMCKDSRHSVRWIVGGGGGRGNRMRLWMNDLNLSQSEANRRT